MIGFHEQVLNFPFASPDREKYENDAFTFNPINYDPEKWVLAAKDAGFEYICFTAKHHDVFCMWDTKTTDYNIMNTLYGKDVLKMLAAACEKHGMMLSIYLPIPIGTTNTASIRPPPIRIRQSTRIKSTSKSSRPTKRARLQSLCQTTARGGSFLLNVGPKPDGTTDETSLYLLAKVGDWYKRMDGCLKEHEGDPYPYCLNGAAHIVTKKNGKSYFHFYNGLSTNSVIFTVYPSMPKSVKLMNTGKQIKFAPAYIPNVHTGCLRISGIPMDTLESEVVVLEIER